MSAGPIIWLFLMFRGRPVRAAACSRSVCRLRKAGIWMTERTRAAASACHGSWMSERTGTCMSRLMAARMGSPFSRPGPRAEPMEERLALSNEALKMKGMPSSAVILLASAAISRVSPSSSMTQGPAIRKKVRVADLQIVNLEECLHEQILPVFPEKGKCKEGVRWTVRMKHQIPSTKSQTSSNHQ